MKYMGSKNRIAKHILPIMIQAANESGVTTWVEPFVGGGNMIDKVPPEFDRIGYDLNEHVIMAMIDIRDNVHLFPDSISEDDYKSLKGLPPQSISSWLRFVASFGGKFDAGYARERGSDESTFVGYGKRNAENQHKKLRNYVSESNRNAQQQQHKIKSVEFICADYSRLSFEDSLIYCDPPYQGTSGYKTGGFDHDRFFDWCRDQAKNNIVFVSEYNAPFQEVWSGEIKTNFSSTRKQATHNAVEKLFRV